jgi:hypothetical protein
MKKSMIPSSPLNGGLLGVTPLGQHWPDPAFLPLTLDIRLQNNQCR